MKNEPFTNLEHEFPNNNFTINPELMGIKMDGNNGLRNRVALNQLKSVDYVIIHQNDDVSFVEFSDLLSQIKNIKQDSRNLYNIIQSVVKNHIKCEHSYNDLLLEKRDIDKITKGCISLIGNELTTKFKDSYLILKCHSVQSHLQNLKYYVVFNDSLFSEPQILDLIKSNIASSIPKRLCQNVIFKPLRQFDQEIQR